jgi:class 3 adenylate cyclase/tetratricopeptide (TPR) repeat protein
VSICKACGRENRDGARFCDSCGAPVARPEARELRKVVTILFCDVTGSTALGERLDSESLRRVMGRYFAISREVLERHGGTVEKFIGDAVMAVFGIPVVHEDDALRATRAAHELREEIARLNAELGRDFGTELQVRIGVNTGEVVTSDTGGTLATGDAVNVAARLEQAAKPGEVLVGEATRQLAETALELEPVEPLEAKGKSSALVAHRLLHVRADAPAFERRFDAPFVGRENESAQLEQAYARAGRDRSCHLFSVLGAAGIGKSRLTHEFLSGRSDAIVLRGRCLAYGDGITYFPVVEILEQIAADGELGGILAADQQARELLNKVSAAVGLADEDVVAREDTFRAVRLLLETFARARPLIVVLDDLHWAEPTLLDLVDHIADWSRDAPMLLLCMARPDLLDSRPGWGGGKHNATMVLLEPLSEAEADTLIDNLLVGAEVSDALRGRIVATAEGNPLFVEQMLALIAQDGSGANGDMPVPPTIQALLATRLEQLPTHERVAAERASVIGQEFWRGALAEIGGEVAALPGLVRKELIRPHRSLIFPADDAFRFRHQLIRDAAYDSMPKELRADLHERFGRWLQANRSEYEEIVGYHYEQSYELRAQLGPLDDGANDVATRAGELLGRAGGRAHERGDTHAAVNLLGRAARLLPASHPVRGEVLMQLGYAYRDAGNLDHSHSAFTEATAFGERTGNAAIAARGRIGAYWASSQESEGPADAEAVSREIRILEEARDDKGLAEGWSVRGIFDSWEGRSAASSAALDRSRVYAARAGHRRSAAMSLGFQTALEAWGHLSAAEGLPKCEALLEEYGGTSLEGSLRLAYGNYLSLVGRMEEAFEQMSRGRELLREFGEDLRAAGAAMTLGYAALRSGRFEEAEAFAREGMDALEPFNERGYTATMAGVLAEALYRLGRFDEAARYCELARDIGFADDLEVQVRWRYIYAKVLAQRKAFDQAEKLARESVARAALTDWYLVHADALIGLADVLSLAGRDEEAVPFLREALELYERKQAVFDVERTRERLTGTSYR